MVRWKTPSHASQNVDVFYLMAAAAIKDILRTRVIQMGCILFYGLCTHLQLYCQTFFITNIQEHQYNVFPTSCRCIGIGLLLLDRYVLTKHCFSVSAFEILNSLKLLLQGPVSFDEAGSRAGVTYIEQNFSKFALNMSYLKVSIELHNYAVRLFPVKHAQICAS